MSSVALIQAVAVTAELCGRTFSEPAARVFVDDLGAYPEPAVMAALRRCRREVRGVLTVQDVVSRLEDGRPGAEEAWALLPKSEAESVVWSTEMAEALRLAQPLLDDGDRVGARMAFKEAYARLVAAARDAGVPVRWTASLGHEPRGRAAAVLQAVELGRLPAAHAQQYLPAPELHPSITKALGGAVQRLTHDGDPA